MEEKETESIIIAERSNYAQETCLKTWWYDSD